MTTGTQRKRRGQGGKRGRKPVRFAVIGQGYFAQAAVLPAFAQADGCELRAIFSDDDTKLRALKRKYGVATALNYAHYDDYLRGGEVDAVYIALPNDMHMDYTVRAAHAGVHVLCEKPMATNTRDAARAAVSAVAGGLAVAGVGAACALVGAQTGGATAYACLVVVPAAGYYGGQLGRAVFDAVAPRNNSAGKR